MTTIVSRLFARCRRPVSRQKKLGSEVTNTGKRVEGRKREVTGGTAQRGSLFLGFLLRIRTFSKKPSSMKATYHATILFSVLDTPMPKVHFNLKEQT
jgi:hypothetical protein